MHGVIDSSLALACVLPGESTEAIDMLMHSIDRKHAAAPALWLVDVATVLLHAERRHRITAAQRKVALELLGSCRLPLKPSREPESGTTR